MRRPVLPPALHSWTMADGYELRGRVWPPARPDPAAAFLYLHGIQSHGGWFESSAALLAHTTGAPVLLPDRRGSGLNAAARGDTPAAQRWLADLDELAANATAAWGVASLDVVAVSWGGKLAVAWALLRPDRVRRMLLIAPGFFPRVDVGFSMRLRIAWALATCPARRFPIPLNDPALFTDNEAGREFIRTDPLKLTHATARFLYASARLDRQLRRTAPHALGPAVTLLLAGRDRIIHNEATRAWLQRVAARPLTTRTFPDAAHTLEFEARPQEFATSLRAWAGEAVP